MKDIVLENGIKIKVYVCNLPPPTKEESDRIWKDFLALCHKTKRMARNIK